MVWEFSEDYCGNAALAEPARLHVFSAAENNYLILFVYADGKTFEIVIIFANPRFTHFLLGFVGMLTSSRSSSTFRLIQQVIITFHSLFVDQQTFIGYCEVLVIKDSKNTNFNLITLFIVWSTPKMPSSITFSFAQVDQIAIQIMTIGIE